MHQKVNADKIKTQKKLIERGPISFLYAVLQVLKRRSSFIRIIVTLSHC